MSGVDLVDWDLAASTARRLAPAGPALSLHEATEVVHELRELAGQAELRVAEYTGLTPAPGVRTSTGVLDRGEWSRAAALSMRELTGPLFARLADRRPVRSPLVVSAGRRVTGLELGSGLAWLSTKVLGQYEIFVPPGEGDGRLVLVAPNIVEVERRLGVCPRDFRLWVCLHEQTHRTQFTAVPWMRGHLERLVADFLAATDLEPAALLDRLRRALRSGGHLSPLDLLRTPEQREIADRIQAMMTLLEGHAEQVMDAVGPQVVPTVATIRARFDERRGGAGPLDRLVRKVLGLEAKLEQYRAGGAFVRAVVEQVGVAGFNAVWTGPEAVPSPAELREPARWVARVHAG